MELYINGSRCSLFGDEEIEITRSWGVDNMLNGYGSYSKTFNIPIDANNSNILQNFDVIGVVGINPNYFIDAYILINEYEIVGNISITGFQTKKGIPYSYSVVFYGDEKNLKKDLDNSPYNSLDQIVLYPVQANYTNVLHSWGETNTEDFYIPIMATQRPFSWKNYAGDQYNINYAFAGTTSGITMEDLNITYRLGTIFSLTIGAQILSYNMKEFMNNLFLYTSKKEFYTSMCKIHTECFYNSLVTISGNIYNLIKLWPYGTSDMSNPTWYANGVLAGTNDFGWNSMSNYAASSNSYTPSTSGSYNIQLRVVKSNLPDTFQQYNFILYNQTTSSVVKSESTTSDIFNFNSTLSIGNSYIFLLNYTTYGGGEEATQMETFKNDEIEHSLSISYVSTNKYNTYLKPLYPKMLNSDFFLNFCKTFNIFYIYDGNITYLYFKDDIPKTIYDLSKYLLIDKDYSYTIEQKNKKIDYKFKVGKDINNLTYAKEMKMEFGELYQVYDYEIGKEKLEFTSIFGVFPDTFLNVTNQKNEILGQTDIRLHSELNDSLTSIDNDFMLLYRNGFYSSAYTYSLQNGTTTYSGTTKGTNYSNTNSGNYYNLGYSTGKTYSLDYTRLNMGINNIKQRYETTFEFLLPYNILYNLKVYDQIFVNGVYWEIKEFTINIKNGKTKIKCISI